MQQKVFIDCGNLREVDPLKGLLPIRGIRTARQTCDWFRHICDDVSRKVEDDDDKNASSLTSKDGVEVLGDDCKL